MASNGDTTLVVWQDDRDGYGYDIYGARLDRAGVVLSVVRISAAPGQQSQPAVAGNGTDFLVVWTDYRNGVTPSIYGARVTTDGRVLDPQGIRICTAGQQQVGPSVASDGAGYLVVWQDSRSRVSVDIYGTRVLATGAVLDAGGLAINTGANHQINPAVSGKAGGYLVVWQDQRDGSSYDIYGTSVSVAGVVSHPAGLPISTAAGDQINPAVTANGRDYWVAWQDFRSDSHFDIYGTVVTGSGLVSQPGGIAISTAANDQFNPSLASDGANCLAVWADKRDGANFAIYGARLTPAGAIMDASGFVISRTARDHYHPAVTGNGAGYWAAWQDYRNGDGADIYGCRLTSTATVSDPGGVLISMVGVSTPPPATPTLVWANPAAIVYGTGLSGLQLNATANVPGTFEYSPVAGTVLGAGDNQTLSVLFTPTDTQAYTSASATVTINVVQRPLTVTANSTARLYGAEEPAFTVSYAGFVNGDTATALGGTLAFARAAGESVGSYLITPSGLTSGNYALTFNTGTLSVTRAALSVTAHARNKTYGATDPGFTVSYAGFVNSETPAVLGGTLAFTRAPGESVGSYLITPSGLTSGNYAITFNTGTLSITQAALSVTADARTKTYGATDPALTVSYAGFVNSETPSVLGGTLAFTRAPGESVGSYLITPSGLTSGNYAITFNPGALSITKAALTVTADNKTKTYGATDPAFTASYVGFVNSETPTVLGGTLAFARAAGENVGSYLITPSGLISGNYAITFVNGTLTVTPAPVLMTGLTVQPAAATITAGQTQQFTARATYSDVSTADVTGFAVWQSANPAVATVTIGGRATGVTAGTASISASRAGFNAAASLTVTTSGSTGTKTFSNSSAFTIRDQGPAAVYPSPVSVSGLSGTITKVTVRLIRLTHSNPDDLDILLVGPGGQKVLLMSDAGGSEDVSGITLTLDDAASAVLPDSSKLRSATYKPANYQTGDVFSAPAPAGPYAGTLSAYNNTNPSGPWRLYIMDDNQGGSGSLSGGWSLTITTVAPAQ
jgi:subtilisin-like proprotein convertase family protein